MNAQDNIQTPMSQAEILQKRKAAILNLITEMSTSLPPMVQTMVTMYRGTVIQFIDNLTFEQTEEVIAKAQSIINDIRG